MIALSNDMPLFHGSYTEIRLIDFSKCSYGLDFGKGFYVTSSLSQAVSYVPSAVRKAIRRGIIPDSFKPGNGIVTFYTYRENSTLKIHCFQDANADWLHFASSNRNFELFPDIRTKYAAYDIIGGKIADDQTALVLNNYISGSYGEPGTPQADNIAIGFLEPDNLKDQFCFLSEKSLNSLIFTGSENYGNLRNK